MTLLRIAARPMLASMFIYGGAMALKDPGPRADKAQPAADLIKKFAPDLPVTGSNLTRFNGAAQLLGGLALATGHFPRIAAFGLAATLPPTTLAGHPLPQEHVHGRRSADGDARSRSTQEVHRAPRQGQSRRDCLLSCRPDRSSPQLTATVFHADRR